MRKGTVNNRALCTCVQTAVPVWVCQGNPDNLQDFEPSFEIKKQKIKNLNSSCLKFRDSAHCCIDDIA